MTTIDDVKAGDVLGRYELLVPVAKGGMAMVWAARLTGTRGFQKIVAIKTMLPTLSDDPNFEQMFLDEAQLASRIHHPHVVEILDLGEQGGVLYIVMEWLDGEPVTQLLRAAHKQGGIPVGIAVRIVSQVCRGLQAAHELRDDDGQLLGLVHRDISPQNVIVTYDGVAKVFDFGVAKAIDRVAAATDVGQIKGKMAYMAPEQIRGEPVDRRADVFALGELLYLMTTGTHPFKGDNQEQTVRNILSTTEVASPTKLVKDYPPMLAAAVRQALAKDPAKRFPTANDMLKALERALPPAVRVSTDEEVAAWVKGLTADRLEKRRKAIRAAIDASGRQGTGANAPVSSALLAPMPSQPEIDSMTESSSPSGVSSGGASSVGDQRHTVATDSAASVTARPPKAGGRPVLAAAGAVVVLAGLAAAAAFALGIGRRPTATAATSTGAPLAISAPSTASPEASQIGAIPSEPSAPEPSASASAAAPASASAAVPPPDSASPAAPDAAAPIRPHRAYVKKRKKNVSPIQTPGF